jgi:hypothetical protein
MADTNQEQGSKKRKTRSYDDSSDSSPEQQPEPQPEQQPQITEPPKMECPVCYTDGSTSGIVKPACCDHVICLECYTNIVVRQPTDPVCPCCRAHYLAQEQIIEASSPMYSNQITEAHYVYLDHLILSTLLGLPSPLRTNIRVQPPQQPQQHLLLPQESSPTSDSTSDTNDAPD